MAGPVNGVVLGLGAAALVAAAGVVHQRGMRGSGAHEPAIPSSLAHVIPADATWAGKVGPGRCDVWRKGVWSYAVDLDASPPRLVNTSRDPRNATQADVWAAADAEVGPRFDLDRERGSRSMPYRQGRVLHQWDVVYRDGLPSRRVSAVSAKAAILAVRRELEGLGRDLSKARFEAVRATIDGSSLGL